VSVDLTIAGTTYPFPTVGENNWGQNVTNWATAVSTFLLQRTGGAFSLTNDVNFGANFATVQIYLKSRTANIATLGFVRLANTDAIAWRNAANNANLLLGVDGSNQLTFNGDVIPVFPGGILPVANGGTGLASYSSGDIVYASGATTLAGLAVGTDKYVLVSNGSVPGYALLVNANIDPAAAIAYSKLALTGSIVNTDISASAAIAYSKLALTDSIVNADINTSAAIAYSKLAALTASKLLESSAGGVVSVSTGSGFVKATSGTPSYQANISLTTEVTGILPKANGGSGQDNSSITFPASGTLTTVSDVQCPLALASRSTNLSLTSGATVDIIADTEIVDSDAAYNNATGVFTVPTGKGGVYEVGCNVIFATSTAFNGTTEILAFSYAGTQSGSIAQFVPPSGNINIKYTAVTLLSLAAGNTVKITATQDSGSGHNIIGSNDSRIWFRKLPNY